MIIGLVGTPGAGKETTAKFLMELNPKLIKLTFSDAMNEELKKRDLEINRENQQNIANEHRNKFGSGIWAERLLEMSKDKEHVIIDGIRSLGEIDVLKKNPNFYALGIDADIKKRWKRCATLRQSPKDNLSLKDFIKLDERDRGKAEDSGTLEVDECLALVDYYISNNGTVEELKRSIEDFYKALTIQRRPTWDEVFMKQAYTARSRSTCLRRHVGAVIAKKRRNIASGYNGAPANTSHCKDMGCIRKKHNIPSGEKSEFCRGAHAEQNALSQIAFHGGPSTAGATMYITNFPCSHCTKQVINSGIISIVYDEDYNDELAEELLKESKTKVIKFQGVKARSYDRFFPE